MSDVVEKVHQALIDPQWGWGLMRFEDKDIFHIALMHPVHGKIVSLIPEQTLDQIINGLQELKKKKKA